MSPLPPWVKGDKSTASLIFLISWASSLLCWTISLSAGFGVLTAAAEGRGEGACVCKAEGLVTAFPLNSCVYFSQLWKTDLFLFILFSHFQWFSLDFKYWVICSVGRFVSALGLQIESLFCEPHFTTQAVIHLLYCKNTFLWHVKLIYLLVKIKTNHFEAEILLCPLDFTLMKPTVPFPLTICLNLN